MKEKTMRFARFDVDPLRNRPRLSQRFPALVVATVILITSPQVCSEENFRWLIYFSNKVDVTPLLKYQLIVFDSDDHPSLDALLERNMFVAARLNLGEASAQNKNFSNLKEQGLLLSPTSTQAPTIPIPIDIRSRWWLSRVIEELIPAILNQGFNGLSLDGLDVSIALESDNTHELTGMRAAAIRLVKTIRRHYPNTPLILNGGLEILADVLGDVDYVVVRALYAHYDASKKRYTPVDTSLYKTHRDELNQARTLKPSLNILTLDFWDPKDMKGIKEIYRIQRARGFYPYVATHDLARIVDVAADSP